MERLGLCVRAVSRARLSWVMLVKSWGGDRPGGPRVWRRRVRVWRWRVRIVGWRRRVLLLVLRLVVVVYERSAVRGMVRGM